MYRKQLIATNKNTVNFIILLIVLFGFITILFPLVLMYIVPQSGIGNYFFNNLIYVFISVLVPIYFVYTGIYYYKIKIDSYVINITSYRKIAILFQRNDFIDIPHNMLKGYAIFNRSFTLNKTLMLKIETDSKKIIAKRFNLSFLSKREEEKISKVLDKIIANNK